MSDLKSLFLLVFLSKILLVSCQVGREYLDNPEMRNLGRSCFTTKIIRPGTKNVFVYALNCPGCRERESRARCPVRIDCDMNDPDEDKGIVKCRDINDCPCPQFCCGDLGCAARCMDPIREVDWSGELLGYIPKPLG